MNEPEQLSSPRWWFEIEMLPPWLASLVSHMAIVMVIRRFPPAYQTALLSTTRALVLVFLLCLTYAGAELVLATVRFGRITPMMEISSAWGYVAVPVAGALMAIEMLRQLLLAEPLPPDEAELAVTESQDPV